MKLQLRIEQDENPNSPSEWSDTGLFLVANHRDCYIPEPGEKRITNDAQELVEKWKATHHIFGLEAYIHSGVTLELSDEGNFPDRQWDVSQLGFVFAAKDEWKTRRQARKAAESLISTWNMYLHGDVWGFIIEDENGNHVDSCWGFYGREYCEKEGNSALQLAQKKADKEAATEAKKANAMACRSVVTA